MHRDTNTPQKPNLWHRFLAFKTLLVSFSLVGWRVGNVAGLVSADARDWRHSA